MKLNMWMMVFVVALVMVLDARENAEAQMGPRNVVVGIAVASHKPNGDAWDALGGAPDIAICTNSAFGQRCVGSAVVASPSGFSRGRCQDSFQCAFTVTVPASGPFSLSIYDVDLSEHDLIGSCMITPPSGGRCGSATISVRSGNGPDVQYR